MALLTRRTLLQGATAFSLAASFGRPAKATPKKGGHLRVGVAAGTSGETLDPTGVPVDAGFLAWGTSKSTLVDIDANGDLIPKLAETWEVSSDLHRWTFNLRQGVTFHSGKPLTAQDVVASLNLHRGDATTSAVKPLMDAVTDITAEGDHRVVITLSAPNMDFPNLLKTNMFVILPVVDGAIDVNTTDGTGPYKLVSWIPGQSMAFERNPDYWDLENEGHFDTAEVSVIPDPAARMNALRSGQVDLVNGIDLKTVNLLRAVPGIAVDTVPGGTYYAFPMMTDVAPFNDINVRMALKYAINRQELVDKVLLGFGEVGNDTPISPRTKYFNTDLVQREYDPDRARSYLRNSGLESIDIPLSVAEIGFPGATMAGELFANSASAAGINIQLTREADDTYYESVWLTKPFTASYWTQPVSCDMIFSIAFAAAAPWNETHFNNARFEELLITGRSTVDEAARASIYFEMQEIIHNEGGLLNPFFTTVAWARNTAVAEPQGTTAYADLDSFRCIARWSMA
ncbi:MAG: ABC transporter substrate-binding protein [Rubellimicrobium sp.]|nr:ABC transporter substrate-binding protein [Rubellimicrobium sp.]